MGRFYKSKYKPRNPEKYGNPKGLDKIICRSSWERAVCVFLDKDPSVVKWMSEEIVVNYISKVDGRPHRYFIDFYVRFKNGKQLLIEVKPHAQTLKPKTKGTTKKQKERFLYEAKTYATNISKWEYAKAYAQSKGMTFVIWTEKELEKLGININPSRRYRAVKYGKAKKRKKTT